MPVSFCAIQRCLFSSGGKNINLYNERAEPSILGYRSAFDLYIFEESLNAFWMKLLRHLKTCRPIGFWFKVHLVFRVLNPAFGWSSHRLYDSDRSCKYADPLLLLQLLRPKSKKHASRWVNVLTNLPLVCIYDAQTTSRNHLDSLPPTRRHK